MPIGENNWSDLMKKVKQLAYKIKKEERASYNFRNVYFLDEMLEAHIKSGSVPQGLKDIPTYMHMARHVYRSANYTKPGQYVKCFHNPEKALILHNHFPLGCLGGICTSYPVDPSQAHLQHYRSDCVSTLKKSCEKDFKNVSVLDTTMWKFNEPLIKASTETLFNLGFFKSPWKPSVPISSIICVPFLLWY